MLATACDDEAGAIEDALDRAEVGDDAPDGRGDIEFRPWTVGGSGSTRLNTAHVLGSLPVSHFERHGLNTMYPAPLGAGIRFIGVNFVGKGYFPADASDIQIDHGRARIAGVTMTTSEMLGSSWDFEVWDGKGLSELFSVQLSGAHDIEVPGGTIVPMYNFRVPGALESYPEANYPGTLCDQLDTIAVNNIKPVGQIDPPPGVTNEWNAAFAGTFYHGVQVDPSGSFAFDEDYLFVGCASGSSVKAALWGYPPYVAAYGGMTGLQQTEAASRAITADYCADGSTHTEDGTPIQVVDRFFSDFDDPIEETEAIWGGAGSQCKVDANRVDLSGGYDCGGTVTQDCNKLGSDWVIGPDEFMWTKVGPNWTVTTPRNDCDVESTSPGCKDPGVETVVCDADAYCCSTAWDSLCVGRVASDGADAEACCTNNGTPGCGHAATESCVAAYDSYCTGSSWDTYCAAEVELLGCGTCR
jgi:hypothetical protein